MKDESHYNEAWATEARMNFEDAVESQDWETARAVLGDLESYHLGDTYELRRKMNLAMAEEVKKELPTSSIFAPSFSESADLHNINFHE